MGLVLHVMQGSLESADSWFHNGQAQASAHFGSGQDGRLWQWVDTADRAWAEAGGNDRWVSIEHEGFSGQPPAPTAAQVENDAQLVAWLHTTEGIPLRSTDDPSQPGVGWHGMGGFGWGGHFDCPGPLIRDARPQILARAAEIIGGAVPPPEVTTPAHDCHVLIAHPSGKGYWIADDKGEVYTFGPGFHGSLGGKTLAAPIVDGWASPSGNGYALVAADGGVFTFGDASFHGSTGGKKLAWPVVRGARTPGGAGYHLLGQDGGVFSFGDAAYLGSVPELESEHRA